MAKQHLLLLPRPQSSIARFDRAIFSGPRQGQGPLCLPGFSRKHFEGIKARWHRRTSRPGLVLERPHTSGTQITEAARLVSVLSVFAVFFGCMYLVRLCVLDKLDKALPLK